VRVAERGADDASPVVMLHGWGASLYTFRHAFSLLPPLGFRVSAVDLRGYGLSDHPRTRRAFTLEKYLSDLISLLEALDLPRAAIIGHSMGGAIALQLALREPARLRALALINPAQLVGIPLLGVGRLMPRFAVERIFDRRVPRWLVSQTLRRIAFSNTKDLTERDVDEYWSPARIAGYVHAVRGALDEFDWRPLSAEQAATLAVPTVVILGQQDRLIPDARRAAGRLAGATVIGLSGGHCVHEEQPDAVYSRIAEFFGRWQ
jgi:pimeloyl-ACP methyl ester carboxylesterase